MRKKFFNRFISFLCAVITMINPFIPFMSNTSYAKTDDDFIGSQILLVDKGTCGKFLTYDESEIKATLVVYSAEDGAEYPAYCNEPSFQGVGSNDIHYGEYVVKGKIKDDRIWRVVTNGYPYKNPSEMGVNGEREAFFTTKQALYRTLDNEGMELYGSLNEEGENMLISMQELYDIGVEGTDGYVEPKLTVKAINEETTVDELDPQYKSQLFEVQGNCEFDNYEVSFDLSDLPLGTKITDENGIEQTTFDSEEKFKVMIPVNENSTTGFNVKVTADLKSMPLYYAECENIRMQTMLITASPYETVSAEVTVKLNPLVASIEIQKRDSVTNEGLGNATFEVEKVDGQIVGTYITDSTGSVKLDVTENGYYKITEVEAPDGYLLSDNSANNEQIILVEFNKENVVTFLNDKKAGIEIRKIDKDTSEPLENAKYRVSKADGTLVGEYTTNRNGTINIQDLEIGTYDVEEIQAPTNYLIDTTIHKVNVAENEVSELILTNKRLTGIQIVKKDSLTDKPLANATFEVVLVNSSYSNTKYIGDFTTDEAGSITIPNLYPGVYGITEIKAPRGYNIDVEQKLIEVSIQNDAIVELTNTAKAGLQIKKVDENTGEPLANAKFRVTNINGQSVGEYTTSRTGFINIPELEQGYYIVEETQAPDGYILDTTPKTVEVRENAPTIIEFTNKQKGGIQILKVDEATGTPLQGAKFRVTTKNGMFIGEYETDRQGHINLPELDNGWYTILEIEAPDGYILDDVKKDVEVTGYKTQIVEFTNKAKAGIQIIKRDSVTKNGIKGVQFEVTKINGELVGRYMTNAGGLISISDLDEGWYIVTETSTVDGYKIDAIPRNVEVKSNVPAIVEFENEPYASLVIQKIDSVTGKGIKGVRFNITKENGEFIGNFTTDEFGQIKLSKTLQPAIYLVKEISTVDGYKIDNETQKAEITWGDNKIVQVKNHPYGSLRVIKLDSKTNKKLEGVRYRLETSDGELIGKYRTNENGEIFIEKKLEAGIYYLMEIDSLDNYITDTEKYKITINWGKTTVIELENTEITGKIQIVKKSKDNNEHTDELAETLLKGATFEIRNEENKVVDKLTTNADGVATSKLLPYGVYKVKEISAPKYYLKSESEYTVEIQENAKTEILEVYNESVKLATSVTKTGIRETQCLDVIRYDFSNIANKSNVSLDNFVWHDSLPIETKIQKIYTGTWNQNLTYTVSYKTNMNKEYTVFRSGLFTNQVYELDFSQIPLQVDEYITDYIFDFGTVKAGFSQVEAPFAFVKVNNYLASGREFINYTEVSGNYDEITVSANDSWKTIIYNYSLKPVKLPKTGN